MNIWRVIAAQDVVAKTIGELGQAGRAQTERFALWLGRRADTQVLISESYVPDYKASSDYFHIGRAAMACLIEHLRENNLMIGVQLHTHPEQAFHSLADDRWAIVRHIGALSIVLPYFARATTGANFLVEARVFALSQRNKWTEVPPEGVHRYLEIVP